MSFINDLFAEIAYIAASGMADVRFFGQDKNGGESDGFIIIITPIARPFNSPAFADATKDAILFPANDNRFEPFPPDNDHRIQAVEEFLRETYEQRVREEKERPWRHAKTDRSRRDVAMEAYRANHAHFFAVSVSKKGPRPRSSRNPRIRT
ncbi:hypothetical protein IKQ74_00400 [Candidatus Saccharibacteria bacterium]|nr:hypothetical protein [Candidatus Saccharibacteria bacterium]